MVSSMLSPGAKAWGFMLVIAIFLIDVVCAASISSVNHAPTSSRFLASSSYSNRLNFTLQSPPSNANGISTYIVVFDGQQVIASLLRRPYIFMGQFPKSVADSVCSYIAATNQTIFYANFRAYGVQYTDYKLDLSGLTGCSTGQQQIVWQGTNQTFGVVCGQYPYASSCALYLANSGVSQVYCQVDSQGTRDLVCGSCDYVVQPWDICASISNDHGITQKQLLALNPSIDPQCKNLKAGQILQVCISCPAIPYVSVNTTSIPYEFAPYVYLGGAGSPSLDGQITAAAIGQAVLSYITAPSTTDCQAVWNGNTLMLASGPLAWPIATQSSIILSLGGKDAYGGGLALSQTCADFSTLAAQYQAIINKYHPVRLDFDLDGAPNVNHTSLTNMIAALVQIQTNNPTVELSFTVPASPKGLSSSLQAIVKKFVNSNLVFQLNLKTLEGSNTNSTIGVQTTQAAEAVIGQLQLLYPCSRKADLYGLLIITPRIGYYDGNFAFTLQDASVVASYASANQLAGVSMWSLNRDHPCPPGVSGPSGSCSGVSQTDYAFANILQGKFCRYTVQPGDQCDSIASMYNLTTTKLLVLNPSLNPQCSNIEVGQVLQVCTSCIYTVQQGDVCNSIAAAVGITTPQLMGWNPSINSGCTNLAIEQVLLTCSPN